MKINRSNPLLEPLLGPEEMERLRRSTLEAGLAGLRCRRARRQARRVWAVACLLILPICIGLLYRNDLATRNNATISPSSPSTSVAADPAQNGGTKIITDEELFALFPGRPLALVGNPGHQQLVFLDQIDSPNLYLKQ